MCLYFYRIYKDSTDNFIVKYVFVFLVIFCQYSLHYAVCIIENFSLWDGWRSLVAENLGRFYFILPLAVLMEDIKVMRSSRHNDSKRSYSAGTI